MKIKFLCLNLWFGGKLFDNVITFIKKENPDIIAFQEAVSGEKTGDTNEYPRIEDLKNIMNFPYAHFAPAFKMTRPDMPGGIFGNAVFSKFPIVKTETTFFDVPYDDDYDETNDFSFSPRNLEHVRIDLGGKELNVFNTQGIWGFDGDDNDRRLKMSEVIREKYFGKKNVVLCGDFNTKDTTKAMTGFEKDLKNVFKGELTSSFNMRHKPVDSGFASTVVDMIYVSPEIKVANHYSTDEDVTDHIPLVCEIEI